MTFALFFALMFLNYGLLAINYRMIARGSYFGTAWTDASIAVIGFTLIQHVATADTLTAQSGYVLGGVCGAQLGLWLTRKKGEKREHDCAKHCYNPDAGGRCAVCGEFPR